MYWHRPPLFNPNNFLKNPQNIFGNVIAQNMFCVPKIWGARMEHFEAVQVPMT